MEMTSFGDVIPIIASYTGSGYQGVSKEWKGKIDEANKGIIDKMRSKYPNSVTLYELVRSVVSNNNIALMKEFINSYIGYIPIDWVHILSYIKSKEMAIMIRDKYGEIGKGDDSDVLAIMIEVFDQYTPEYIKSIISTEKWNGGVIADLNLIHRIDLLSYASDKDIEAIILDLNVDNIIPINEDTIAWIKTHQYKNKKANVLINDNSIEFAKYEREWEEDLDNLLYIVGLFDAIKIFEYEWETIRNIDRGEYISEEDNLDDDYKEFYRKHAYRGKILDKLLKDNEAINNTLRYIQQHDSEYLHDNIEAFEYLYRILEHGIDEENTYKALAIAINHGWIEILDRWLNRVNVIPSIIKSDYLYTPNKSIRDLLAYKGMHPSWFKYYSNNAIAKPNDLDPKFWLQYLPNLLKYGTEDHISIIKNIIEKHKAQIGSKMREKMKNIINDNISLVTHNKDILSLLEQKKPIVENKDMLFYFSKSADKAPGKGVNEQVGDSKQYAELSKIKDWRKVLSNFYIAPFKYNGYTFRTAEHAFHYSKILLASKEMAKQFTMESGSSLGMGDGEAARGARKMVILNAQQLAEWSRIKDKVLYDILYVKFSQSPMAKQVLLVTNNAQLWHGAPRTPKERQYILEQVRDTLRS